jgi:hypothetical protein
MFSVKKEKNIHFFLKLSLTDQNPVGIFRATVMGVPNCSFEE